MFNGDLLRRNQSNLILIALLIFLAILAYGRLIHGYFATDEWWAFSYAIAARNFRELLLPSGVYAPSANMFIYWLYQAFGLNALVWALIALGLHLGNTVLLYVIILRLSSNRLIGFLAAAAFTVLPMGSQFLHQFSMMPTSGMATFFALLALLAYVYRRGIVAAILFFIALSFSPYAGPFVLLLPLMELVLFERKNWKQTVVRVGAVGLAFGAYLLALQQTSLKSQQLHDRPISGDSHVFERLLVVGQKMYQSYGELWHSLPGTIDSQLMLRTSTWIIVIALVLIVFIAYRRQWLAAKVTLIGLLWIPFSVSLFSTLNTVALDATFPGRYFYVTTVGVGLMFGGILAGLLPLTLRKVRVSDLAIGCVALLLIGFGLPKTQRAVAGEVELGQRRRMIMDTITTSAPKPLGRDALFCFTSNVGHYGTGPVDIPLPFVHNFNFNLAVYYRADVPALRDLFTESGYFVNPAASYYHHSRDKNDPHGIGPGIGFATNMDKCRALKEQYAGILDLEDIYAFAYDGNKGKVTDITAVTRQYLAGDQSIRDLLFPW